MVDYKTIGFIGVLLAAGAVGLQWLEYRLVVRTHPLEVYLALFALACMGLGAWVAVKPKGTLPTGIDHCAAYDPTRDHIYYYTTTGKKAEDNFFVYDVKENAWSNPKTKSSAAGFAQATIRDITSLFCAS